MVPPKKRVPLRVVEAPVPAKKASARRAPAKRAPRKVVPKSVAAAAASGDHRQLLVALQARIARSLDDPNLTGAAFAALVKQSREIAEAIAAIDRPPPEPAPVLSCIAQTPDEPWDESMV